MWDLVGNNEIIDAFQFDTPTGSQAAKKVKPHTLPELATAKQFLSLTGLTEYDSLNKDYIDTKVSKLASGETPVSKATSATYATTATKAGTATYASSAASATNASTANFATKATNADTATYATNAGTASKATSADSATSATNAGTATYAQSAGVATKLGTATIGSATKPIYLNAGVATTCTTYAGGTRLTLNGTSKAGSSAAIFAPTVGGTTGYVLKGAGTASAPVWEALNTYTTSEIDTKLSSKSDTSHNHDSKYDAKGASTAALASAKSYTDNAVTTVKNDLLNGAGAAYDTLKELGDLIDDNADAIEALETIASGKANAEHEHEIADVTGLQTALDGKAASSHGTHVTWATGTPKMNGTAAVGTVARVAREDHIHPVDTSRAAKTDFDTHVASTVSHITSSERTAWNAKASTASATTATAGLMSAADKVKLNGIATGANKTTVDSALSSSSTNPVQNKVINSAITTLTSSVSANTSSINTLTTAVGEFEEISLETIQALFA